MKKSKNKPTVKTAETTTATANTPKRENLNKFQFTGRIVEKNLVVNREKGYARFTVAHNMGKRGTVFSRMVMFSKNFSKEVQIPWDLITKGRPVEVKGYLKANVSTIDDQKKYYDNDMVVLEMNILTEEDIREKGSSKNCFAITGHICGRGLTINREEGYARFTIGHNQGPKAPTLFVDLFVSEKNGSKTVNIPWDDLKEGSFVKIGYFTTPNTWEKDGKKMTGINNIVASISAEPKAVNAA